MKQDYNLIIPSDVKRPYSVKISIFDENDLTIYPFEPSRKNVIDAEGRVNLKI